MLTLSGRNEAGLQAEALRALGIPVLELALDSFADLKEVTRLLGRACGKAALADEVCMAWQKHFTSLEERFHGEKRIRVFFEVRSQQLLAAGKKNIVSEIIRCAGGENVVTNEKKLVRISEEALLALDPEAYIIQQGPMNPAPTPLTERPALSQLTAARKQRVLLVEEELFSRPGPQIIDACERLGNWLHSDAQ